MRRHRGPGAGRSLLLAFLVTVGGGGTLAAQAEGTRGTSLAPGALPPELRTPATVRGGSLGSPGVAGNEAAASPSPARSFVLSAAVPGAGQYSLGLQRWVPYAALEVWGWIRYLGARSEGHDLQESYRDLAWLVARRVSVGPRMDGDFEYYEALTEFTASGAYDADSRSRGIQPETDETTYNGSIWALARALFFPADGDRPREGSAAWERALSYYRERAVDPRFAWDWGENGPEQDLFAERIEESDEALRRATILLGVIIGNHFASAVDALITARLREAGSPVKSARVRALFLPTMPGGGWGVHLRLGL